ncbi:hypothetical protein BBP40_000775 [Aspergillus hancockii]|nr:hypothetical protein BBP40_000775 [Aspergillus hancockii]
MLPNDNASVTASFQHAETIVNKHLLQDLLPYNGTAFRWPVPSRKHRYHDGIAIKLEGIIRTVFSTRDNRTLSANDTLLYLCLVVAGGGEDADDEEIQNVKNDVVSRKMDVMRALTPGMGGYLNEADRYDPSWKEDFWGQNYEWLKSIKEKYDYD